MRRSVLVMVAVTVLPLIAVDASRAGPVPAAPAFHPMACPAGTFRPHTDVTCGYIRVPENRTYPTGRTITVAAAVLHAPSPGPRRDPIVFLNGGPSFGAISSYAPDFYFAGAEYAQRRDVILVDTRGTGLSRPRLGCPELDRAQVAAYYSGPSINSRAAPIYRRALQDCRNRLVARDIDLASYNTAESAADLDALRRALGVRRWNLFAASADGPLGLTYLRMFPSGIRSAVIDSGMSTQMRYGLDYDRGMAEELESIFAACAAHAPCNERYPGLRGAFYRTVRRLQTDPATVAFPHFQPQPVKLVLDGAGLFADAIYSIFPGDRFSPSEIPLLLNRIWRETHGELVPVYRELFGTGPVQNGHSNSARAAGKSMSYICHDSANFLTGADLHQAARDLWPFAPRYLHPQYDLADGFINFLSPAGCDVWDVGRAPRVQHEPVTSSIPTLVLAGQYDAGVPPYIVRQVMAGLSDAHYYEFPKSAHLQLASYTTGSVCARSITTSFLAEPTGTPDSSCLASQPLGATATWAGEPRSSLGRPPMRPPPALHG